MRLGFILAATLQIGFSLPTQLQGPNCQTSGGPAVSLMAAHARLLDAGLGFLREDSLTRRVPGSHVTFGWDLQPGDYWVEVWASNRAGAGCIVSRLFQVPSDPGGDSTQAVTDPLDNYEVFDITGRRIAKGRGQWKSEGMRRGIYWVRRGEGGLAVVRTVVLR